MLPERNPSIVVREEEAGKFLVFNKRTHLPLIMNKTSFSIWKLCDGSHTIEEIERLLRNDFDMTQANLTSEDLKHVIEDQIQIMQNADLLLKKDASSASI